MNRFIFIEDGVVCSAVTADIPETGSAVVLCDLLSVFSPGDSFDQAKYELAYPDMHHPFTAADSQSLIYCPTPFIERSQLEAAGLQFNPHAHVPSKYVYTRFDTQESFDNLRAYGAFHSVAVPDFSLCDKSIAPQKFEAAGFTTLATRRVTNSTDIEDFAFDRVILKPAVSSDTYSAGQLAPALYKIYSKTQAVAELNALGAFSTPAVLQSEPIIVQQVSDGEGDKFDALILSGCVNGAGNVWHFSPLVLETRFNEVGRYVRSTWAAENDTAETADLQNKVSTLLAGNKNCFYHLQFLKSNGAWVPHDFQFRTTYYTEDGLAQTDHLAFKQDIIKFTYDRSTDKPALPCAFGLYFLKLADGLSHSQFIADSSRSEVLSRLGTL
jgi:hypothetical protein